MAVKLSSILRRQESTAGVRPSLQEYEHRFNTTERGGSDDVSTTRQNDYRNFTNLYYNLVTDFYEYGWGRSFHFAPGVPGESFETSIRRHEHFLAHRIGLKPGMVVADLGCGIAGPLLEMVRFAGVKAVGVNSNSYQLEKAQELTHQAGLSDQVEFLNCDFLDVDAPDGSFDAVYAIEATCCAPDKPSVYAEAFRLLKPGGHFGAYEFILTDRFDAQDPRHRQIKRDIELGGGLLDIDYRSTVDEALRMVGFEVLETRDLAVQSGPAIAWYQPLEGTGRSLTSLRRSRIGRSITHNVLTALEAVRVVPRGSVEVHHTLNLCADAMVAAGRLGIFSPMYFLHGERPR